MTRRMIVLLLCLMLCLSGAALAEATLANPWVEAAPEDIAEAIGAAFGIPEGAEDISYSLMPDAGLAEMRFAQDGREYVARIQPAEAFTDISGLFYEWEAEAPFQLADMEGLERRTVDGDQTIDSALWFDEPMGFMYALYTSAPDLDDFDISAVAAAIYVQAEEAE